MNSLGNSIERQNYCKELYNFFQNEVDTNNLSDFTKQQLEKNPLRILDSKDPDIIKICEDAPKLRDYLTDKSLQNFDNCVSS